VTDKYISGVTDSHPITAYLSYRYRISRTYTGFQMTENICYMSFPGVVVSYMLLYVNDNHTRGREERIVRTVERGR